MNKISNQMVAALAIALPMTATAADEVTVSGAVEVELSFSDDYAGKSQSDIALATVVLGVDTNINDRVTAHVALLHEDDDTEPMEVDEGIIGVDLENGWYFNVGRMYVPFGVYETNLVSDPLTLEIGETREAALQVGFESNGLTGSVYMFNGDTIETTTATNGEDTLEHFGFSIGKTFENDKFTLDIGIDYISSIGDSDGLFGNLTAATDHDADALTADISTLKSYVSGTVIHAIYNNGPWTGIVEMLQSDQFQVAELAYNGVGAEPSAMNVEVGYEFSWGTGAIGIQSTDEAFALSLPESRIAIGVSKELFEATSLSFEYAMDDDYSIANGGTGKDKSNITAQLAVEF